MAEEQRAKDEGEEQIVAMLKDITASVQSEIEMERGEREKMEEQLLLLLEETCKKLYSTSMLL